MNKTINKKEIISVSIVWTIIATISSIAMSNILVSFLVFMLPVFAYWFTSFKFGSSYIIERICNLNFSQSIFESFSKTFKIENLEKSIIDGSAVKKSRMMIICTILIMTALSLLSPLPLDSKLGVIIVNIPLLYPAYKGYKLTCIALLGLVTADLIAALITGSGIITSIIWMFVLSSICTYSLYIENTRITFEKENKIPTKKQKVTRDIIITISSYIVLFALMVVVMISQMDAI